VKLTGAGAVVLLTGCTPSQIEQTIEGILTESAAITKAAGQIAWSQDLTTAAADVQLAWNTYQAGANATTAQKLVSVLNAVIAVTAAVLPNDPYASLIDELVALVELGINLLTSKSAPTPAVAAHTLGRTNPHIGAVPTPTSAAEAKTRWNAKAIGPLAKAAI
jgi:hypothetical protein